MTKTGYGNTADANRRIVANAISANTLLPGDEQVLSAFKTRVRTLADAAYKSCNDLLLYMEDKQNLVRELPKECREWQNQLEGLRIPLFGLKKIR